MGVKNVFQNTWVEKKSQEKLEYYGTVCHGHIAFKFQPLLPCAHVLNK